MRRPSLKRVGELVSKRPKRAPRAVDAGKRPVRLALASLNAIALICIGYVGTWFYLAMKTHDEVISWFHQMAADGRAAEYSRLELSGFPFALRVNLENTLLGGVTRQTSWLWRAKAIVIDVAPFDSGRYRFEPRGEQILDMKRGDQTERFIGNSDFLQFDLDYDDASYPHDVTIRGEGIDFKRQGDGAELTAGELEIRAALLEPQGSGPEAVSGHLSINGSNIQLPPDIGLPLGGAIRNGSIEARVMGVFRLPLTPGGLALWRDDGGTIEVDSVSLSYDPLYISASGTVALDAKLQPIAAFTGRFQGFFQAIDALRDRGIIRSREATMAKLVLGAMSRKGEDGGARTISLPITIQERSVFAGPVPLAKLPPIRWTDVFPASPDETAPAAGDTPADTRT
ncbi:MAG: DUF2125 domain-containing protein [Rhodospirillales bacterium]|nr:DUF2125 domain-containing protein [Rhodospirillales bacterium]